jgi:hypothetical protein
MPHPDKAAWFSGFSVVVCFPVGTHVLARVAGFVAGFAAAAQSLASRSKWACCTWRSWRAAKMVSCPRTSQLHARAIADISRLSYAVLFVMV